MKTEVQMATYSIYGTVWGPDERTNRKWENNGKRILRDGK
jgi:hypothetical protein